MVKQMLTGIICLSVLTGLHQPIFAAENAAAQPAAATTDAADIPAAAEKSTEQTDTTSVAEEPETMMSAAEAEAAAKAGAKAPAVTEKKVVDEYKIMINLAARSLGLYKNGTRVRLYPIGPGKAATPTPVGYYSIRDKEENPVWTDPGDTSVQIASGEGNPLGYRWMQFFGNYGIHGTNHPESVGNYVSNGCIRMKEADVEELYGLVPVGTPIEIMYNRIVVEKGTDNTIAYYIYPDGYDRQAIDVAAVTKWLAGYGVDKFESDADIAAKIETADGQPTFIAKAYALHVNGDKMKGKAVLKDDITYLPAVAIAENLKLSLNWQPEAKLLVSPYGKAAGYMEKDTLYFNADDAGVLFHLEGGLNTKDVYELNTITQAAVDQMNDADAGKTVKKDSSTDVKTKTTVKDAAKQQIKKEKNSHKDKQTK